MTSDEFERFRAFLQSARYQPQTVANYATTAKRLALSGTLPAREFELAAIARFAEFLEEAGETARADAYKAAVAHARGIGRGRVAKRRDAQERQRQRSRSYPDAQVARMAEELAKERDPAARALEVMLGTALRVGDVLSVRREAIAAAMQTGAPIALETKGGVNRLLPVTEDWNGLWRVWLEEECKAGFHPRKDPSTWLTVADMIARKRDPRASQDGRHHAAYKRMQRLLQAISERAGVTDRTHTHRIRRTVAVQAIRTTGDLATVQQMMGHKSPNTTMGYLDEARPDDLLELSTKLRAFRGPTAVNTESSSSSEKTKRKR